MAKKIRPLGQILCYLEEELYHEYYVEDLSLNQVLAGVYSYAENFYPDNIEEYTDGTHPVFSGTTELIIFREKTIKLLDELFVSQDCQVSDIIGLIYAWTCVHAPDKIINNAIYYGPKD